MYSKEFKANWKQPPVHSNAGKFHKLKRPDARATEAVNSYRAERIRVAEIAGTYPFPAPTRLARKIRKKIKN